MREHTEPNLWKPWGGEVGLEKHTHIKKKKKKKDNLGFFCLVKYSEGLSRNVK